MLPSTNPKEKKIFQTNLISYLYVQILILVNIIGTMQKERARKKNNQFPLLTSASPAGLIDSEKLPIPNREKKQMKSEEQLFGEAQISPNLKLVMVIDIPMTRRKKVNPFETISATGVRSLIKTDYNNNDNNNDIGHYIQSENNFDLVLHGSV